MIQKDEILSATNKGKDIFTFYIPDAKPSKPFKSPFREDRNPSANIYESGGKWYYKDLGNGDLLDCFEFVQKKEGCGFKEALELIVRNLSLTVSSSLSIKKSSFKVEKKEFSDSELKYWNEYGINKETLNQFKVSSVKSYSGKNKEEKDYTFTSTNENPVFAYEVSDNCHKIYKPLDKFRFQWIGNKPSEYVFGLTQLPEKGDYVLITGGEKDVLSLVSHGFPAICFNSENTAPPASIIEEVKKRFQKVIVLYDADKAGKEGASKIAEAFQLEKISLPDEMITKGWGKDISDYFRIQHNEFEIDIQLSELFNLNEAIEEKISLKNDPLFTRIKDLMFDAAREVIKPEPIISIEGNTISTAGNLTVFKGASKSGKSGILSGIIGGAISIPGNIIDTCGIEVKNSSGKLVLHVDTEQSQYDYFKCVRNVLKRSEREDQPRHFKSVLVREFSLQEKLKAVEMLLDIYGKECGGVHLIIIDGIADFVSSVNDEQECNRVVHYFEKLAIKYSCPVITVIHLNPSSESKGRGHLDSQLERKAESVIKVVKDKGNDISFIDGVLLRNAGFIPQIQFQYDTEKGYHVGLGAKVQIAPEEKQKNQLTELAGAIFEDGRCKFSYSKLVSEIMEIESVKERSAKSRIAQMRKFGIIDYEGDMKSNLYLVQRCKIGANG